MKTSIQLLFGLFALIVVGLFYVKYDLSKVYSAIDKTDPFYEFNQIEDLSFSHIKVEGGNDSHLHIESGEKDALYIYGNSASAIEYNVSADTLYISYDSTRTVFDKNDRMRWGSRKNASVIIQTNSLNSVAASNASVALELENSNTLTTKVDGITQFALLPKDDQLASLEIISDDMATLRINRGGDPLSLAFMKIGLSQESLTELYNIKADSTVLELDVNSRISADANFFNETVTN